MTDPFFELWSNLHSSMYDVPTDEIDRLWDVDRARGSFGNYPKTNSNELEKEEEEP